MRTIPYTLYKYIGKQFAIKTLLSLAFITTLIILIDGIEVVRKGANNDIPFAIIIDMVFLRAPYILQNNLIFAILIGSLLTFHKMTQSSELIIARSSGISVWQFVTPAIFTAFIIGIFIIFIFNPFSATLLNRFEKLEAKYYHGNTSMLAVSNSGLWLRENNEYEKGKNIIHALRVAPNDIELLEVIIFIFAENNKFVKRIDASTAKLKDGYWDLKNVIITSPEKIAEKFDSFTLSTSLKIAQIQDSFSPPETISFWELPAFINMLQEAGFPAVKHSIYWYSMIILPLLLCSIVLISSAFTFSSPRSNRFGILLFLAIITGFVIYFFINIVAAIGVSGKIPIILAAWSPAVICLLIGIVILLHLEDG